MTGTRLDPILASVRAREAERRRVRPLEELQGLIAPDPSRREAFVVGLRQPGLSVIAECKRHSPSAGYLGGASGWEERARRYRDGGAAAISVLTEEDHFRGSLADLAVARRAGLPLLRKDFLLDDAMVFESQWCGADAVLLLAVCLQPDSLRRLSDLAHTLGMAVLLEVHDEAELERAVAAEPDCIGVNARDLRTFEVDLSTTERLLPQIPERFVRVAESGIRSSEDGARVRAAGADAVLMGESLMRAADPAALIRSLRNGAAGPGAWEQSGAEQEAGA